MIPVYQTIIGSSKEKDPNKMGNCMQAVIASLLELPLDEVPHFLAYGDRWWEVFYKFLLSKGIEFQYYRYNPLDIGHWGDREKFFDGIKSMNGIKGYFFGSVYSPGMLDKEDFFKNPFRANTHAVVIDKDLNIVHDPNPNYKGMKNEDYPLFNGLGGTGVYSYMVLDDLYGMYL